MGQDLATYLRKTEKACLPARQGKWKKGRECATAICLYGELGSGKTTFVQGFAKGLGITKRLLSPTFIIVRRYNIPKDQSFLYHVDLYRVTGADLEGIGITEILADSKSYVVVEWAEKLGKYLPDSRIDIWLAALANGKHKLVASSITSSPGR